MAATGEVLRIAFVTLLIIDLFAVFLLGLIQSINGLCRPVRDKKQEQRGFEVVTKPDKKKE